MGRALTKLAVIICFYMAVAFELRPENPTNQRKSKLGMFNRENLISTFKCPPEAQAKIEELDYTECKKIVLESLITKHPDQSKRTPEILFTHGYSYEEHKIMTEDGYILTVYRIVKSQHRKMKKPHNTPVYLNHGLIGASDWWFMVPPRKSLPCKMFDEGYDVWMSNGRGTTYSLEHESLDYNKDISYWDFSFHEMGIYDMVSVTDVILEETESKTLIYVGYSMASNVFMAGVSEVPMLNDKIRASFILGPSTHIGHTVNPIRSLCTLVDNENRLNATTTAVNGRLQDNEGIRKIFGMTHGDTCTLSAATCGLCDNFWFALNGLNAAQLNRSHFPYILEKVPNSASVKTLAHFAQLIESCRFQKYDYFKEKNLEIYGSEQPPLYNLRRIKVPLYMYHGLQDNFGLPIEYQELLNSFRKGVVKKSYLVKDKHFNHLDFSMAKNADKLVYNEVISDMYNYRDIT